LPSPIDVHHERRGVPHVDLDRPAAGLDAEGRLEPGLALPRAILSGNGEKQQCAREGRSCDHARELSAPGGGHVIRVIRVPLAGPALAP
jgi:hypothetical protein